MKTINVKGFRAVSETDVELVLKRYWAVRWLYLLPLFFGLTPLLLLDGFMLVNIMIFAIPLIHLGGAGLINNAIFIFDKEGFKFKNRPIPWFVPRDYSVPKAEIKQILLQETRRPSSINFDVCVELRNGKKIIIKTYDIAQDAKDLSKVILDFINNVR